MVDFILPHDTPSPEEETPRTARKGGKDAPMKKNTQTLAQFRDAVVAALVVGFTFPDGHDCSGENIHPEVAGKMVDKGRGLEAAMNYVATPEFCADHVAKAMGLVPKDGEAEE